MLTKLIEKADLQNWSAITLQTVILSLNIYLYSNGNKNSFVILSGVLILSLFCLQVVSRRFLMFYPRQGYMNVPSPKIDTTILRCFLIISICFMFAGALNNDVIKLKEIEFFIRPHLYWIIPILIPLLPLLWHFFFADIVRNSFVEDMKKLTVFSATNCPNPECKNLYAQVEQKVLSQNSGQVTIKCDECGKEYIFKEPITGGLGY